MAELAACDKMKLLWIFTESLCVIGEIWQYKLVMTFNCDNPILLVDEHWM